MISPTSKPTSKPSTTDSINNSKYSSNDASDWDSESFNAMLILVLVVVGAYFLFLLIWKLSHISSQNRIESGDAFIPEFYEENSFDGRLMFCKAPSTFNPIQTTSSYRESINHPNVLPYTDSIKL